MHLLKSILLAFVIIIVVFVVFSLLDVFLSVFSARFYSYAAFVAIFGVGGIFAAFYSYSIAYASSSSKNNISRWTVLITMLTTAILFFFLFARYENEYGIAFKSFAVTIAATSLFLGKTKPEI